MSSDIERVIQRDLDQLPLLPAERWVPAPARPASRGGALLRGASVTVAVLALALVLGASLSRLRTENAGRAATTSAPIEAATAPGAPGRISRQAALSHSGLLADATTVRRIEAKLVSRGALLAAGPSIIAPSALADQVRELNWVVAVQGDIRCLYCQAPTDQPFNSGLYFLDARTGMQFAVRAYFEAWPSGFDALADESISTQSVTIVARVEEIRGPDLLIVSTDVTIGSAAPAPVVAGQQRFILRADSDTQFSWAAGEARGTAYTLDELVRNNHVGAGAIVRVTFDPQQRSDGTYRLESLLTGVQTR